MPTPLNYTLSLVKNFDFTQSDEKLNITNLKEKTIVGGIISQHRDPIILFHRRQHRKFSSNSLAT